MCSTKSAPFSYFKQESSAVFDDSEPHLIQQIKHTLVIFFLTIPNASISISFDLLQLNYFSSPLSKSDVHFQHKHFSDK